MSAAAKYFVRRQGRVEGPWAIDKLQAEVRLRKLGRYHEVSLDGNTWQRAADVDGLFDQAVVRKTVGGAAQPVPTDVVAQPASPRDEAVWYCVIDDDQRGPMTKGELGQLVDDGLVMLDDLVWQEGYADWLPAEEVAELSSLFAGGRSASHGAATEATRLVPSPSAGGASKQALTSAIAAGVVAALSCIPVVGLAGIVPIVIGGLAFAKIRKSGGPGMPYALIGLGLGIAEVLWGFLTLVLAIAGTTSFFMNR